MDDGRRVVTDAQGRYSITGLLPGVRSIKAVAGAASEGAPGADVQEGLTETSRFVLVPVGGVVALHFGLSLPAGADLTAEADQGTSPAMGPRASTLPSNVSVGMLDILIPAGSDPYVRYGSFFSRTE